MALVKGGLSKKKKLRNAGIDDFAALKFKVPMRVKSATPEVDYLKFLEKWSNGRLCS